MRTLCDSENFKKCDSSFRKLPEDFTDSRHFGMQPNRGIPENMYV